MSDWPLILFILLCFSFVFLMHSLGHYWVSRFYDVSVRSINFGFGKPLYEYQNKQGVLWIIRVFPLGCRIQFTDTQQLNASKKIPLSHKHFDQQSIFKKIGIISAGPAMNVCLGLLLLIAVYCMGVQEEKSIIYSVTPQSAAFKAGLKPLDTLLTFDGVPTPTWNKFRRALLLHAGENNLVPITLQRNQVTLSKVIDLSQWDLGSLKPNLMKSLGIGTITPTLPAVIGEVIPNSPAAKGMLQKGDRILVLNEEPIDDWYELSSLIADRPNQTLHLTIQRGKSTFDLDLRTDKTQTARLHHRGNLGIKPQAIAIPPHMFSNIQYPFLEAVLAAAKETLALCALYFSLMGKILVGKLGIQAISGPFDLVGYAMQFFKAGIGVFIQFIASISILFACINMLPFPGLDGGQIYFLTYEAIKGKRIKPTTQFLWVTLGTMTLVILGIHATINDILRWLA